MKTKIMCIAIAIMFLLTGAMMITADKNTNGRDIETTETSKAFPDGFTLRKEISIRGQENPGYQLNIEVGFDSGDIHCSGNCNSDFSDLVFTQSNGDVIPHWIEAIDEGSKCMVWVNNLNNDDTIHINYGCPFALDSSDGEATFPAHFEDWSTDNTGDYTQNAGGNPTDRKWSLAIDCPDNYKCRYRLHQQTHKYATSHGNTISVGVSKTQSRNYLGAYFQFCDHYNLGASWQNNNCAVQSYVNDGTTNEAGGWYTVHTNWNVYEISATHTDTIFNQYTDAFEGLMHTESSAISDINIGYVSYYGDFAYGCESSGDINTFSWNNHGYVQMYMWASNWWYDHNAETVLVDYMFVAENQANEPALEIGDEEPFQEPEPVEGDVNGDGCVNGVDLQLIQDAFLTVEGDENYNPDADLDGDGDVDIMDWVYCMNRYGNGCPFGRQ